MNLRKRIIKPSPHKSISGSSVILSGALFILMNINVSLVSAQNSYYPDFRGISYGDSPNIVRQKKGEPLAKDCNETKRQEIWQYADIKVTFVDGGTNQLEVTRRDYSLINQSENYSLAGNHYAIVSRRNQKPRFKASQEVRSNVPFNFGKGEVMQLLREISLTESSNTDSTPAQANTQAQIPASMIQGFRPSDAGRGP